ncbi:MAG: VCBS repeat-containing protein, partial [Bacteroidia bacterium]|nr:VCBS repeat-containing protein [Bacteroidia bacterium]
MKKTLFFIFVAAAFGLNAQVCFTAHADYIAGTNPNAILSGDFNKDGFPDLVCNNGGTNEVLVYFGDGTGTYPATGNSYTTAMIPQGMCMGYFNLDTFPDIAVTFAGGGGISVLLNDSAGGFGPFANYYGGGNPQSVTSADFNLDGFTDLA